MWLFTNNRFDSTNKNSLKVTLLWQAVRSAPVSQLILTGRDRRHLWELGGQMATAFPFIGSLDLNLHLLQKSCWNNISTTGLETRAAENQGFQCDTHMKVVDYSFNS